MAISLILVASDQSSYQPSHALPFHPPPCPHTLNHTPQVKKWITEDLKFPWLDAFERMTPALAKTVMTNYLNLLGDGAFETLTAIDLEVIWTAVSAANNCELCLSFHAMTLGQAGKEQVRRKRVPSAERSQEQFL